MQAFGGIMDRHDPLVGSQFLSTFPLDSAYCEAQYNALVAVPDHMEYFARRSQWAQVTRVQLACETNLAYGQGERQTLDWFPAIDACGVFIFIHGGYWRANTKNDFSWVAEQLVPHGISVAVLNYPLCPQVSIGQIIDSVRQAVAWLYWQKLTTAERVCLVVGGHSAGGHLTAAMFTTDWKVYGLPDQLLAGGFCISGLFDLIPLCYTSFNEVLKLDPQSATAWSPMAQTPTQSAPLVLVVGELESMEFQEQNIHLMQAWPQGLKSYLRLEGCHHFSVVEQLHDPNSVSIQVLLRLFGR